MKWRVYYADGTTFDGTDPTTIGRRFEVQVIVQEDKDHGHQPLHFADYYIWRADLERWIGVEGDLSAMMALTQHIAEITCLLWGSMMDPYEWAKIQAQVRTDFPEMTARRKYDAAKR